MPCYMYMYSDIHCPLTVIHAAEVSARLKMSIKIFGLPRVPPFPASPSIGLRYLLAQALLDQTMALIVPPQASTNTQQHKKHRQGGRAVQGARFRTT